MKTLLLVTGILLLIAVEVLRVYFIMPFPGSQRGGTLQFAYWLHNNILWLRILGFLLVAWPAIHWLRFAKRWKKVLLLVVLALYGIIFYFFNYRFLADKMFLQPRNKIFAYSEKNQVGGDRLILGITLNGESRAYPIQLIGYHHQVRDTVGDTPVMVTYCTVCRTGRVFSPVVNGHLEDFRLVGMDRFNAMFEDATTGSWWQQATGLAVAGPLRGTMLPEIPSSQMTLDAWLRQNPRSLIMQPDTIFRKQYEGLSGFDEGTIASGLEKRDTGSWQFKSWVVGIQQGNAARAFDWNELVSAGILEDSLPGLPLVIVLEPDMATYHAWNRMVDGQSLSFTRDSSGHLLRDRNTQSSWNMDGLCIEGSLEGQRLSPIRSSQEFWHSWQTFHPAALR